MYAVLAMYRGHSEKSLKSSSAIDGLLLLLGAGCSGSGSGSAALFLTARLLTGLAALVGVAPLLG